jgi:catechol 2,3-dioxygenase-like lactoylglutathione lyase family enzyme
MSAPRLAAAALLVFPVVLGAQNTPIRNVRWLEGCWQLVRGTTTTVERWLAPVNGEMSGESWTIANGAERPGETLRLFARGDTLVYQASPAGQATTQFRTTSSAGDEIVFANPAHDFPQRIVYRRVGADSVIARIEGDRAGRRQPVLYPYAKVPCSSVVEAPSTVARRVLAPLYDDMNAREAAYGGASNGWLAEHAAPGFRHMIWASGGPTVPVGSALLFARADSSMKAAGVRPGFTNLKYKATLEQLLPRGDTVDALVSIQRSWNFADTAGIYGARGGTPERSNLQRRLDRWVKTPAGYKLAEVLVVSDESSVDGRLLLKNGKPVPARAAADGAVFQTTGAFFAVSVPNADSSRAWYVEKLGMRVIMESPRQNGTRVIVVTGGGLTVELLENASAVPLRTAAPAINHTTLVHGPFKAGFYVDDFDATLGRLRQRGVAIAMGPFPAGNGAGPNVIIRDNAGNLIQIFGR